eukprot:scaffold32523_cov62-Isochrysis_galbana.AAC.1
MTGGSELQIDIGALEIRFARPEARPRRLEAEEADGSRSARGARVRLLDTKRSTSIGIVANKIRLGLNGKGLREAVLE